MCGIAGIHLRDDSLIPQLGSFLHEMVEGIVVRGPDSAGVALYGDRERLPEDYSSVSLLSAPGDLKERLVEKLPNDADVSVEDMSDTTFIRAKMKADELVRIVRDIAPEASVIGSGEDSIIYKGIGNPMDLRETYRLSETTGWRASSTPTGHRIRRECRRCAPVLGQWAIHRAQRFLLQPQHDPSSVDGRRPCIRLGERHRSRRPFRVVADATKR